MFYDIVMEELSYLEIIGIIVVMFNCGVKGELVEVVDEQVELYCKFNGVGNDSYVMQVFYGGGLLLMNLVGVLWMVVYIDLLGELMVDLCLNIVVEVCVKIIYEWLINVSDDFGVCDVFGFFMMCEVLYQKLFEKVFYVINGNFFLGKLLLVLEFSDVYFKMLCGGFIVQVLWNSGMGFELVVDLLVFVDGGDGNVFVNLIDVELEVFEVMKMCLVLDLVVDFIIGVEFGEKKV